MHFSSNKYSGRRNSVVGFRARSVHQQKFFDPTPFIYQSQQQTSVDTFPVEQTPALGRAFSDFAITDKLKQNIAARGYTTATPVQEQTIPLILAGKDVVGLANTGTGKTAAFLIPLINKTFIDRTQRVLIITPTRELAVQIRDELEGLSQGMNISSVLTIGGVSIEPQRMRLQRNPQFVIGTPGRIKDLGNGALRFSNFQTIVLDEVDRMLDIGFVHEIRQIIFSLPQNRHSLFFSATLSPETTGIMNRFLNNPVTVSVKRTETLSSIRQEIVKVNNRPKLEVLHELLVKEEFSKVLLFGRTKHGVDKIAQELENRGFKVAAIHGNKNQNQRQRALNDFKNNAVQVLLATDVASRGLDISNVTHVINYELPESLEDYIHRIGRTGRANKTGVALTFTN